MPDPQPIEDLITEYASLMRTHGKDSPEANRFYARHSDDPRFADSATGLNRLKKAFEDFTGGNDPPGSAEVPARLNPMPPSGPGAIALQEPSTEV